MACSMCRGSLVPIEAPSSDTTFQCLVCGTVDTAEAMMARALRKAVKIIAEGDEEGRVTEPAAPLPDADYVESFLKSLGMSR